MPGGAERPFQRRRLKYDSTFALEAGYAVEQGIAFSRYLREFSMEDRSIIVAVKMAEAERCHSCGMTTAEFDEDPLAYEAVQVVCPWCAMKDRQRNAEETDQSIPGASIKLLPRKVVEAMRSVKAKRPASRRERARQQ